MPPAGESRAARARRFSAVAMLMVAATLPLRAWPADCGVDGTLIRDAAVRGLGGANNMINTSAADIMSGSRNRVNCLERFGLISIPPLGIPGVSAIISQLANNAMEQACQQAMGSASRYLSSATGGLTGQLNNATGNLTSVFSGVQLPPLSSVGNVSSVVNGAVNGAINNAIGTVNGQVTNAVNGAVTNATGQVTQALQPMQAASNQTPTVWERLSCWVSSRC